MLILLFILQVQFKAMAGGELGGMGGLDEILCSAVNSIVESKDIQDDQEIQDLENLVQIYAIGTKVNFFSF